MTVDILCWYIQQFHIHIFQNGSEKQFKYLLNGARNRNSFVLNLIGKLFRPFCHHWQIRNNF